MLESFSMDLRATRGYLKANVDRTQILDVMVKIIGLDERRTQAPLPVSIAVVIDTSYSMNAIVEGGVRKIDKVIEALKRLVSHESLRYGDELILIRFDSSASVLYHGGLSGRATSTELTKMVESLRDQLGNSTHMATGIGLGLDTLRSAQHRQQKLVLFTDGEAHDEDVLRATTSQQLRERELALISYGVGDTYNEDLLTLLADRSAGDYYHLQDLDTFSDALAEQLILTQRESGRNLRLEWDNGPGNSVRSIHRIYPTLARYDLIPDANHIALGHLRNHQTHVFLLELDVAARPAVEFPYRVTTLLATCDLPDRTLWRSEQDVEIYFSEDPKQLAAIHPEVYDYVTQRTLYELVERARSATQSDKAVDFLQRALGLAERSRFYEAGKAIQAALEELQQTGKIRKGVVKTMLSQVRTRTQMSRYNSRADVRGAGGTTGTAGATGTVGH